MGSPEKYLSAHHADAWAVAKDIIGAGRLMPADDGNAARHKLGKGIAHAPQHPQLRRSEAGVVFCHGHAARPDIAGNINLALSHGISHAVGGIAANDDLRSGIEPSHVIRRGPDDVNKRVRESH